MVHIPTYHKIVYVSCNDIFKSYPKSFGRETKWAYLLHTLHYTRNLPPNFLTSGWFQDYRYDYLIVLTKLVIFIHYDIILSSHICNKYLSRSSFISLNITKAQICFNIKVVLPSWIRPSQGKGNPANEIYLYWLHAYTHLLQ